MGWYLDALFNYADFEGRATRAEYWWFGLFNASIAVGLSFLVSAREGPEVIVWLYLLLMIVPSWSVSVRRLHDSDKSGWWLVLSLIPFGGLILFLFFVIDGTPGPNRYGPDPKGRSNPSGYAVLR